MSPTRRSAARKKARKPARKAARKVARKPARKAARKVARRATRKTARKVARKTARKAARMPARKTARAAKPRLRVVRSARPTRPARPAKRATPPPDSFPQRRGASAKQLMLFELIRARAALLAAIHGLPPAAANEPMGKGKWSARETVLHLVTRDQARLREIETTLRGQPASWKGIEDPEMGEINERLMAPLRHLDWDEAVRQLHRARALLLEAVESVPDEPAEVWSDAHAFGWMMNVLPPHDRHHADVIKRWRAERSV
jgi:hypothetical protein